AKRNQRLVLFMKCEQLSDVEVSEYINIAGNESFAGSEQLLCFLQTTSCLKKFACFVAYVNPAAPSIVFADGINYLFREMMHVHNHISNAMALQIFHISLKETLSIHYGQCFGM